MKFHGKNFGSHTITVFYPNSFYNQMCCKGTVLYKYFLFDLILYVPVNSFSVMSGRFFLGRTSTKQGIMCLAQGHNAVTPVRLEPATLRLETSTLPLSHCALPLYRYESKWRFRPKTEHLWMAVFACFNPCHAKYFDELHSSATFKLLTSNISVVSMYFQSEWKQCRS